MSCVLRIAGKALDIDDFIQKSGLSDFVKKYKKEDKKSKNPGSQYSYVSTMISEAHLSDFEKQKSDAVVYLKKNKEQLAVIKSTAEIEFATVNFMVGQKSVSSEYFAQYIYLPSELTDLCGRLGIGIEVSIV